MGAKIFNGSVAQGVRYLIALYDVAGGELLALVDAAYLTAARTGATTGVATRYLAPEDATSVGVIGSGLEARTNLEAVATVRPLKEARVYSPTESHRARFAEEMTSRLTIAVEPTTCPEAAVEDAHVVIVATNTARARDPIAYRGAWLRPGQHVNSIGSTGGGLREIDPETFRRAEQIVVDSRVQVEDESDDVHAAREAGVYEPERVSVLKDWVSGSRAREGGSVTTLFKSVGTAVQDLAAAAAVYREAKRCGRGRKIDSFLEHKQF